MDMEKIAAAHAAELNKSLSEIGTKLLIGLVFVALALFANRKK